MAAAVERAREHGVYSVATRYGWNEQENAPSDTARITMMTNFDMDA